MSTTLMCLLLAVAFTFDRQGMHWLWSDEPQVAVVLFVLALVLGSCWLQSRKQIA